MPEKLVKEWLTKAEEEPLTESDHKLLRETIVAVDKDAKH